MVFGFLVTSVLDITVEITIWSLKKIGNGVYYLVYNDEEVEKEKELKEEVLALKNEIHELKEVLEKNKKIELFE